MNKRTIIASQKSSILFYDVLKKTVKLEIKRYTSKNEAIINMVKYDENKLLVLVSSGLLYFLNIETKRIFRIMMLNMPGIETSHMIVSQKLRTLYLILKNVQDPVPKIVLVNLCQFKVLRTCKLSLAGRCIFGKYQER